MTDLDDLIARLRGFGPSSAASPAEVLAAIAEAAAALEALQAENERLREAIQNEAKAFQRYKAATSEDFPRTLEREWMTARAALKHQ